MATSPGAGSLTSVVSSPAPAAPGEQETQQAPTDRPQLKEHRGEDLPDSAQRSLREIVNRYEIEHNSTWRYFHHHFAKADYYWRGIQNIFFDAEVDNYREITRDVFRRFGLNDEEERSYLYPVNFYTAMGESIIAILLQRLPKGRFVPVDFEKEVDVIASKAANAAKGHLDRVNQARLLYAHVLYLAYTHGVFGSYTRFKVDKDLYGSKTEMAYSMGQSRIPPAYFCDQCGSMNPAANLVLTAGLCVRCKAPLQRENLIPEQMIQVPQESHTFEVPNGQVKTDIHDGLEMRLPFFARTRAECPFLGLVSEIDESALKNANPDKADKITGGYTASGGEEGYDRYLRLARMQPYGYFYGTGAELSSLVTWRRWWLRPYTFWRLDKDKREELLHYFPQGVKVHFANDVFLLAENESMDDHWSVGHTMPGVGMYRNSIGQGGIPLQESYNFDESIKREWIEYKSFEPEFVDVRMVNVDALNRRKLRAREMVGVDVPAGKSIHDAKVESRKGRGPEVAFRHATDIFEMARFVVGAPPSLSGGMQKVLKPMAFAADRDLALGRKGIHYTMLVDFWNDMSYQQVKIFSETQEEDVRYQLKKGEGYENVVVPVQALKGGKFSIYPEIDEGFPALIEQQRETYMKMLEMNDEEFNKILAHPRNIDLGRQMFGLKMYIPGEDDRHKQLLEIDALLKGKPMPQMVPHPTTGMPTQRLVPSIPPNPHVDNHAIHAEEIKNFLVSSAGIETEKANPGGFANCIAHLLAHEDIIQQEMQAEAQAQMAMQAQAQPQPTAAPAKK